jgi:hypothetical protein
MHQDTHCAAVMCVPQDFREVQDAHEKFVKTLKQQSLVYSAKMMGHIHHLLSMARRLCALVRGARGAGIDMDSVQVRWTLCAFQCATVSCQEFLCQAMLGKRALNPHDSCIYVGHRISQIQGVCLLLRWRYFCSHHGLHPSRSAQDVLCRCACRR